MTDDNQLISLTSFQDVACKNPTVFQYQFSWPIQIQFDRVIQSSIICTIGSNESLAFTETHLKNTVVFTWLGCINLHNQFIFKNTTSDYWPLHLVSADAFASLRDFDDETQVRVESEPASHLALRRPGGYVRLAPWGKRRKDKAGLLPVLSCALACTYDYSFYSLWWHP